MPSTSPTTSYAKSTSTMLGNCSSTLFLLPAPPPPRHQPPPSPSTANPTNPSGRTPPPSTSNPRSPPAHPALHQAPPPVSSGPTPTCSSPSPPPTRNSPPSPIPAPSERDGLWNRDVVEIFVTPGETTPSHYFEYEVAPTGEKLDLRIEKPNYDLAWNGNFTASAHIDDATSTYTAELKIPFADFGLTSPPEPGAKFRLNLYRHDVSNNAFVAWNPTASRTAHRPDRFGHLTLTGSKK